jgi:tetratricopeptide (TPR) repeat protein
MIPAHIEEDHMYAAPRSLISRFTRTAFAAMPFAIAACGGDQPSGTLSAAEAPPTVEPVRPASNVTTPVVTNIGGTGVSTVRTFDTGDEAYKAGKYREATEMYKVHVGARPEDSHAFYMLGLASWKSGDLKVAKEAFDKTIELNPKFAKSYFNGARVLLDMKRAPEALEMIEKGRSVDSTSPDGVRLKARAQSESGDVEGAVKTYRELLVNDDADTWGLNNLGILLLNGGKFEEAVGPLARVVQVQPRAPLFQNNFGMALERSGFKRAALRHYEEAVRNDSTFTKAVKNVERLKGTITETNAGGEVSVEKLAEDFRQLVKTWKTGTPKSE